LPTKATEADAEDFPTLLLEFVLRLQSLKEVKEDDIV
jgi:hypothetical protein